MSNGGLAITGYKVTYNGMELDKWFTTNHALATEIHGLQPNTDYTMKVAANNALGPGQQAMINTSTMSRKDQKLFTATPLTSTTLMVKATNIVRMRTGYLACHVSPNDNGQYGPRHFNLTETVTNVSGLNPATMYTIKCVMYAQNGTDTCIQSTENVTTKQGSK